MEEKRRVPAHKTKNDAVVQAGYYGRGSSLVDATPEYLRELRQQALDWVQRIEVELSLIEENL